MTLIAGEIVGGEIRLGSDTQSTDPYGAPSRFLAAQLLKIVLLHPGLCVAYAGNTAVALDAIRALGIDPDTGFDLPQVSRALLRAHRGHGQDSDFLVAALIPSPSLLRISGGQAVSCDHEALLGSQAARLAYRSAYASTNGGEGEIADQTINRIEAAIEAVIDDPKVEGVGGFCIRVASKPNGFVYLNQGIVATAQAEIPGGTPAGTYLMPLAGTAEGGYRYTLMTPEQPGLGAVGLYFQPGNFGLLLYPYKATTPIQFSDVTQEEFIERARLEADVVLARFGRLDPI